MVDLLRAWLTDPRIKNISVDSPDLIHTHRQILMEKKSMREVFSEFYKTSIDAANKYFKTQGKEIELGAGSSIFKIFYPQVMSSDIKSAPGLDLVVNAEAMPFKENEIRALYLINCFHHFPDPHTFFQELDRVVSPGGGAVLIEPYFGFVARHFYRILFRSEHFDMNQKTWKSLDANHGSMTGANQALSYIVFFRDKEIFLKKFPSLEIVESHPLYNYLRYFFSGGLNFRPLFPELAWPVLNFLEFVLRPVAPIFALHYVIVIRKKS
jgi:SAM-dependent methyltransferase